MATPAQLVEALSEPRGIPTIFGEILEKNVVFCIDTSGSMYKGLDMVKEHLLETLVKMGNSGKPYMFNVIEFNSEVTQWSDKLVTCTPQTVAVAKEWINKLSAKTGTNTKGALLTALNDPRCGAVYLVTDGLPDHHPVEILDHVGNIGKMRPIHCIYLSTEETTESSAIEFLEDLSIESYGSFHIVGLTSHGCVERITPIYRAEHANERVIRTINGTIRPNTKTCGVATTLQVDPDDSVLLAPRVANMRMPPYYPYGPGQYMHDCLSVPFRYYYPHAWSRYRPAKGWIKAQEQMTESIETSGLSPAAGSLLIDKFVLARRLEDGYFYQGKVKSQILSDKFLVGFGPCKHGKFTETTYQDTSVYDIIDYDDAKRHTILTGDKVLAPWEPEGERYGPGTVIEGHEKRGAEGPEDKPITVSFTNGKVVSVTGNTSVWLPGPVFERLTLELTMPREARQALTGEDGYPHESFEGYPTSGVIAEPSDYQLADPLCFETEAMVTEGGRGPWRYPFHPPYPLIMKNSGSRSTTTTRSEVKCEVRAEDMDALVPGTNLTQRQLDDRVTSQLMEHKLLLDERETEKGTHKHEKDVDESCTKHEVRVRQTRESEKSQANVDLELRQRLDARRQELELSWAQEQEVIHRELEKERLRKRLEQLEQENTLKKSVSFKADVKVEDIEERGGSPCDSGLGMVTRDSMERDIQERHREERDIQERHSRERHREVEAITRERKVRSRTPEPDMYFSDPEEARSSSRERGVNTDSSLLYRPQTSKLVSRRPKWKKYWRADPGLPITNSHCGPFRETALQAPFEARNQSSSQYISEWTSPVYRFVDPQAKHDYSNSVEKLLKAPQPPMMDRPIYRTEPIQRPMSADSKEAARREFKHRRAEQRQTAWNMRMSHKEQMTEVMKDQHRERIQGQMLREKERQYNEQRMIEQSRENKKLVSKEVCEKIESNQRREIDREAQRLAAMQRRRDHREQAQQQREKHIEEKVKRTEEVKQQRSQERWNAVNSRLDREEVQSHQLSQQHQNAKINRIQHFNQLEEEGQRRKDLRVGVSNRHLSMFSSTVIG